MAEKETFSNQAKNMRRQAEEKIALMTENPDALSPEETRQMLHELRVHQIELEMQNEELRLAHAELDAVRTRYFDIYELAPVGYFILSEKGLILEANLTAATLLGITRGALVKQPISRFIRKEDQDVYYLHYKQLFEAGTPQAYDLRMVKNEGATLWVHLATTVAQDSDGEPVIRVVMSNITERKHAELVLQKSEENYRLLFHNINAAFSLHEIILDADGKPCDYRFLDVNPEFEKITGLKAEAITGKTILQTLPESEYYWTEIYGKVATTGVSIHFENYNKELGKLYVVTACSPEPGKVATIFQDITDRKKAEEALRESEERFRSLAALAPAGIYLCNAEGRCQYANPRWCEMAGLSPEEALGDGWAKGLHPEDRDFVFSNWRQMIASEGQWGLEYRFQTPAGKVTWVYGLAAPQRDALGNIVAYIGINTDITVRKQTQEERAKLEAQLQQSQKMEYIGLLAGGIAHDLNNILFPISGLSEMLLDEIPPDNPAHESIEQILQSAQRGGNLVKQILAFSRQSKPQKLPIRIQTILKEALKLSRSAIPTNIEITSHLKPDCGMVSADPTQIHQIVMNLITNAYHAVEGNGGTIDIALKEAEIEIAEFERDAFYDNSTPPDGTSGCSIRLLPGRYVCLSISDTGTGIDQALIHKIFDPYFTTKEQGKGTGLGLSVVHGIVKEHGGDIRVYSEVGKGTVFHVYLPLVKTGKDSKTAAVPRKYPTGCESILLVDDEEPIVRMEQMMLERLGYRVTVRTGSPDALDAFRADPSKFDLVISDRGMPNMTGEQLARELISIRPGIPIILCTGFSDENDELRARAMGIKGFLMKPVATGDLAEMVRKVLDEVAGSLPAHES
ncbi:MAG: PAS domain S-box protein [Pseudomonadota bacterium]